MPQYLFLLSSLLTAAVGVTVAADEPAEVKFATAAESKSAFEKSVSPFLAKHCTVCHSTKKAEGDLDLTKLDPDMKATTSGARWAMVVEKLATGEMPPKSKPRPTEQEIVTVGQWAHAEAKRAGRPFTRRAAYANGNSVPHHVLFDTKNIPPFDGGPRVRRLSPEIYAAFANDLAKGKSAIGQPFSPEGKSTFKDMGAPKMDEPVTAQLIQNALAIVEAQTMHTIEAGKVKGGGGGGTKEFLALFDPANLPTEGQMEAAVVKQFDIILKRSPTADDKKRFVALMKKNITEAGQLVGVRYALAAVLLQPEAVFRMEVGTGKPDEKGRVRLAPREIAYALAYALTDKRPDAELLKAAATGELDTDTGVAKQVQRLLNESKVDKTRILRFFREYFGYDSAQEVFKDPKDNPAHDARILIEDTDRLVLYVLEQDKQVLKELLTTDKSFVAYKLATDSKKKRAEELAKFEKDKAANPAKFKDKVFKPSGKNIYEAYGLKDFPDQQPVALPADQRAGILTQPSWLVAHSSSDDNHVIRRGKWVRERLLGGVVPDLPITVDAQLPNAPEKTLRSRMAVTQEKFCWQCHQLMNDVGYPFEQYDHFGRYRTAELVLDPEATKKNVDNKGKPLGDVMKQAPLDKSGLIAYVGDPALDGPIENMSGYMKKLASSERVEQVFVRHAFRYWMGRNESLGDAASLQAAHKAYKDSNGSMKALIVSLLSSESFLYRKPTR